MGNYVDLLILNHTYIPGIKLSLSWWVILFIHLWTLFANTLLRLLYLCSWMRWVNSLPLLYCHCQVWISKSYKPHKKKSWEPRYSLLFLHMGIACTRKSIGIFSVFFLHQLLLMKKFLKIFNCFQIFRIMLFKRFYYLLDL